MGRSLLVLAGLLILGASACAQPKTWEYSGNGTWRQAAPTTQPSTTQRIIENPMLDRAERLLDAQRAGQAHDMVLKWLKENPNAADRDRGIYLLAEAYFQNGDRIWSFYEADELLEKHPESRLFFPALELQYRVADDFLRGYKKKFLGLPLVGMEDEAIEILYRIQERSPGSPIAERAMLRTADYYYHTAQFDLAADAYGAYVRSFPRSPDVPRVRLQQAFANLAQFRGPRYDATPLIDARAMFRDISQRYPDLARDENLSEFITRIDNTLAIKMYYTADYYVRVGQPKAAVFIYRSLVKTYPNAPEAALAKRQLQHMPAYALAQPDAPAQTLEPAMTQPAGPPGPLEVPGRGQR
jgi:outer membrane assembly lipoprotein YfiO